MSDYWRIPPLWRDEPCFILGGGPSLRSFNVALLRGYNVITINESFRLAEWAEYLYFCDAAWWQRSQVDVRSRCSSTWVTLENEIPGVRRLRNTGPEGLDENNWCLRHGSNSGYQAIHFAYHLGANPIILLGYDMRVDGFRTHWHHGHPGQSPAGFTRTIRDHMLPKFDSLARELDARGIEVFNATPDSALKCFPLADVGKLLCHA